MTHWCWPKLVMPPEMCTTCSTWSQIRKYGIIQTTPVVAINRWNNPPTWLKVATASEEPPTPTYLRFFAIFAHGKDEKNAARGVWFKAGQYKDLNKKVAIGNDKFCLIMMTSSNGDIFHVTGHLCGEFTGPGCIPRTKASDAQFWCFLWSASEKNGCKQS